MKEHSETLVNVEVAEDQQRVLLPGLKKLNVSFKLMTGPLADLYTKSKYQGLFDIVVLSLKSDSVIQEEFNVLLKPNATIFCECGE